MEGFFLTVFINLIIIIVVYLYNSFANQEETTIYRPTQYFSQQSTKPPSTKKQITKFESLLGLLLSKGIIRQDEFFYSPDLMPNDTIKNNLMQVIIATCKHLCLPITLALNTKFIDCTNEPNTPGKKITGHFDGQNITIYLRQNNTLTHYAATIAHECVHAYLRQRNISLSDTHENELLTEVATILLGFGIVYELAYEEKRTYTHTEAPAYISLQEVKEIRKLIDKLPKPKSSNNTNNRICFNCKLKMPKGTFFCKHCGYENKSDKTTPDNINSRICPNCKLEMPKNSVFCKHCGYESHNR